MIYLITGTPGTGKTSFVMSMVLNNKFGLFKNENEQPRQIFSVNVPKVNQKILPICSVQPDDFIKTSLSENFDDGSVIIVDEASEIYPARVSSAKLPPHIEGLNTLRHHGLTLILITQAPTMIDVFVRNLVGKHIHIERKQIGSKLYEWNHCVTSLSAMAYNQAYSEMYKPDKRTFGLYKSATEHIKFKKSLSWHYKAIPILFVVIISMIVLFYSSLAGLSGEQQEAKKSEKQIDDYSSSFDLNNQTSFSSGNLSIVTEESYIPRIKDKEETAPIYDSVRKVLDFPNVVGCLYNETKKTCTCYSQQGSQLALISVDSCMKHAFGKPAFNPYYIKEYGQNERNRKEDGDTIESKDNNLEMIK